MSNVSNETIQVSATDFDAQVLAAKLPTVVDIWAPWCAPCRLLSPILDQLAGEYAGKLQIVKVNYDENMDLAQKFHVNSLPHLLFFHNAKLVGEQFGLAGYIELKQLFDAILAATTGAVSLSPFVPIVNVTPGNVYVNIDQQIQTPIQLAVGQSLVLLRLKVAGGKFLYKLILPPSHFSINNFTQNQTLPDQPPQTYIVGWGTATTVGVGEVVVQFTLPHPNCPPDSPISIPFNIR